MIKLQINGYINLNIIFPIHYSINEIVDYVNENIKPDNCVIKSDDFVFTNEKYGIVTLNGENGHVELIYQVLYKPLIY